MLVLSIFGEGGEWKDRLSSNPHLLAKLSLPFSISRAHFSCAFLAAHTVAGDAGEVHQLLIFLHFTCIAAFVSLRPGHYPSEVLQRSYQLMARNLS